MQQLRIQITGPASGRGPNGGPGVLARILLTVLAVIMLVSAAFLGALFFLAALGVFMVGSVVVAIRIWWIRRQLAKAMRRGEVPRADRPARSDGAEVIEGEYRVVEERQPGGDGDSRGER